MSTDETTDGTPPGGTTPGDEVVAAPPDGDPRPGRPTAGRNLPVAIAVGVVLGGIFLGTLFTSAFAFTLAVILFTGVGVWEAGTVLGSSDRPVARPVLLVTAVVMAVATYALGQQGQTLGLLVLGAFGWDLATTPRVDVFSKLGTTVLLGCWIVFLASFAILLVDREQDGVAAMLAVGGGAIFGDIGGYVFGRSFGRHRIAPTVSPNKTWEGLVGGLLAAGVVGWFVLPAIGPTLFADPFDAVVIAVLSALAGFFGDLIESMVKRDLGMKDLGNLLPGHGGMLDRVDGLLLAFPVGYYALELVT